MQHFVRIHVDVAQRSLLVPLYMLLVSRAEVFISHEMSCADIVGTVGLNG